MAKREHYNRSPDSVLFDHTLSYLARCVYAVLAGSVHQGSTASIGQRRIAKKLGCNQPAVSIAIKELIERGHISAQLAGKQRLCYILASDVFASKQRDGISETAAGPSGSQRLVSCPKKQNPVA